MEILKPEFINLTPDNVETEHLSCLIRSKKPHPGIDAKRRWLAERLKEGHVLRKLNTKGTAMIEYAPLEYAWVPVVGDNYIYIYCLWVDGVLKHHGYGTELMNYCIDNAKASGKSGICMLGAGKQKAWLFDKKFAEKFGVSIADTTDSGYELYALSFDTTMPHFTKNAKTEHVDYTGLTVYYTEQCPFIYQSNETIRQFCDAENILVNFIKVDTLQKAKQLPCMFNNYAVFYKGEFKTVNLILDSVKLKNIVDN